ncbi:MAG: hypothetical protein WCJ18_10505, partial [Planctomycetota bacterium]
MQWGVSESGRRGFMGIVSAGLAKALVAIAMLTAVGTATVAPTLLCPQTALAQDEAAAEDAE